MSTKKFLKACGSLIILMGILTPHLSKAQGSQSHEEALRVKTVLEQSLKKDPSNSELWTHLGFTDHDLNDVDGAQTAFEKAAALNPRNDDALYMLGLIYEKKKMTSDALKSWKAFLSVSQDKWKRDVAIKHIHHIESW